MFPLESAIMQIVHHLEVLILHLSAPGVGQMHTLANAFIKSLLWKRHCLDSFGFGLLVVLIHSNSSFFFFPCFLFLHLNLDFLILFGFFLEFIHRIKYILFLSDLFWVDLFSVFQLLNIHLFNQQVEIVNCSLLFFVWFFGRIKSS